MARHRSHARVRARDRVRPEDRARIDRTTQHLRGYRTVLRETPGATAADGGYVVPVMAARGPKFGKVPATNLIRCESADEVVDRPIELYDSAIAQIEKNFEA